MGDPAGVSENTGVGETAGAARYAIFEDGGKQYRAEVGALVRIDRKDASPGAELAFDKVLLLSGAEEATRVGRPAVPGASVTVVVESEDKGPKVHGLKRRHHARSKTRWGHRQKYTLVRVTEIVGG